MYMLSMLSYLGSVSCINVVLLYLVQVLLHSVLYFCTCNFFIYGNGVPQPFASPHCTDCRVNGGTENEFVVVVILSDLTSYNEFND